LQIDFHFEGGELGAAEEENNTEGGEVEEKDEERSGKDGGTEKRDRYVCPNLERVSTEGAGRCFEFWVKAGEGSPYDADDDGGIVEDVGKEDEGEG
jgi:hypothetical protein